MQYIVMDMEWNNAYCKQLDGFINEIIEIGAVRLDEALQELDSFSVIIRAVVGKKLQSRVKSLTHLTNEDIAHGVSFREAIERFTAWLGEEENTFLTWGDGDVRTLIKNCDFFLEMPQPVFMHNYADLQKYCQGFTDAAGLGQQIGLSAAAEKLGVDADAFPHHRALDDSRLAAACLRKVYAPEKLKTFVRRCDRTFYERLSFKPYYISDLHSPLVDPALFHCVCDRCGGRLKRVKNWKFNNTAFRAEFYCKRCDRRLRFTVRYKQLYDRLDVRKTCSEIVTPAPKEPEASAAENQIPQQKSES